ncbi:MAG: GNAT family N-acetyltransferase [Promethearchaeota archaeon]
MRNDKFIRDEKTSGMNCLPKFVDPQWREKYRDKEIEPVLVAKKLIKPGDRIYIDSGVSEPQLIVRCLIENVREMIDVEIIQFLCIRDKKFFDEKIKTQDVFRHNAFFIGAESLREAIRRGEADYTPIMLSDMPAMFKTRRITIDVAIILVTPPDRHGNCSFGANVDIVKPIAENANIVVAEINPFVPRTHGDSFINIEKIDYFCYNDGNGLLEFKYDPPGEIARKIARYISLLIEDESCLQMGIGNIPNAVLNYLDGKKDLGVHTEVFSDGVIDLVDKGVITCEKKTLHPGKIIGSFVMGSKRLYDFIDDNPFVHFYPVDYVNDPYIIAQNKKQVSINAALSIDFTGQVNSDTLGSLPYSGIGGQVDFTRGAARSVGGKPIITLPSTYLTPDGQLQSRIVPTLDPYAGVTITRGDVHYVVTEYGVAYLHGKSLRERVLQMISIAHPDFRENLLKIAKKINYVFRDQELPTDEKGRVVLYPDRYERVFTLKDGREIIIRPVKMTDERSMQDLYYGLDEEDRFFRFFSVKRTFRRSLLRDSIYIDYKNVMILVGIVRDEQDVDRIVATGGYFLNPNFNMAEIAFTVDKNFRNLGITKILLNYLIRIAQENGIEGFYGTILLENRPMLHVIKSLDYKLEASIEDGEFYFKFKFHDKIDKKYV